jgi:L-amino acid N-acyltransferase YncA
MNYTFAPMTRAYRKPVIDIFNYFIENSFAAYPERTVGYDAFDHFFIISHGYPRVIVKAPTGQIIGFAFLQHYHPASSLKKTAMITCFILPEHTRKGLGTMILERFISEAKPLGIDHILASISSLNQESIDFHLKNDFNECGRFPGIGEKFGKTFDMVWMQRQL